MYQKIRVGAVSYLNAKPLTYGFETGMMKDEVELVFAPPAALASRLLNNELDVALLPVAVIPELPQSHIISDYCIGADGKVASVCLFSEVPLERIERVMLDPESRTSVELLKVLMREHWKIAPEIISVSEGYEKEIFGTTAGLVIGNRALMQRSVSAYCYDLSEAWKEMTGLPFVFAAWVSCRELSDSFKKDFNDAVATGLKLRNEIALANPFSHYDLKTYFNKDIDYDLDAVKRKAMSLFIEKAGIGVRVS